jgi:hypothetical protein
VASLSIRGGMMSGGGAWRTSPMSSEEKAVVTVRMGNFIRGDGIDMVFECFGD